MAQAHTPADEMQRYLIEAYQAEEVAIGKAFTEVLLPGLPPELATLEAFRDLPTVELGRMAYESQDLSVGAAGVPGAYMAAKGITPVHVAQASTSLTHLASLISERAGEVSVGLHVGASAQVSRREVDAGVGMMTELPPAAAIALSGWVLEAACHLPNFLDRYSARRDGDRLVLTWHGRDERDIALRWIP